MGASSFMEVIGDVLVAFTSGDDSYAWLLVGKWYWQKRRAEKGQRVQENDEINRIVL
jgi:hypothetical protein